MLVSLRASSPGLSGAGWEKEGELAITARFTLQKIFGTARVKMARVPKKGFGSDKTFRCKQRVRTKFHPCRKKIFTRAGTFGEAVPARVKMVRVLKKTARFG